jgi:hypothetical protein
MLTNGPNELMDLLLGGQVRALITPDNIFRNKFLNLSFKPAILRTGRRATTSP